MDGFIFATLFILIFFIVPAAIIYNIEKKKILSENLKRIENFHVDYKKFLLIDKSNFSSEAILDDILTKQILLSNEKNFELNIILNKDIVLDSLERIAEKTLSNNQINFTLSSEDINEAKNIDSIHEIEVNFHRIQEDGVINIASNNGGAGFFIAQSKIFYLKRNVFFSNKMPSDSSELDIFEKISELIN